MKNICFFYKLHSQACSFINSACTPQPAFPGSHNHSSNNGCRLPSCIHSIPHYVYDGSFQNHTLLFLLPPHHICSGQNLPSTETYFPQKQNPLCQLLLTSMRSALQDAFFLFLHKFLESGYIPPHAIPGGDHIKPNSCYLIFTEKFIHYFFNIINIIYEIFFFSI